VQPCNNRPHAIRDTSRVPKEVSTIDLTFVRRPRTWGLSELPDPNETFVLLLAESIEGQFANVGNGGRLAIGDQGTVAVSYTAESVEATYFLPLSGLLGDYNGDAVLNIADFDLLSNQILTESSSGIFDENNDLRIDSDDLAFWITELAKPIDGDVHFDGSVSFPDFLVLSANFGMSGNWTQGDFDNDRLVAFPDFLALSANFGQTATSTASCSGAIFDTAHLLWGYRSLCQPTSIDKAGLE